MTVLVTGGGGFLGQAIVKKLLARGVAVRTLARGNHPELRNLGVDHRQGDIADASAVAKAVPGCEAVFHVAAKAGIWGPAAEFFAANVTGTYHVIRACQKAGVHHLIYTSTPSVIYQAGGIEGADERIPYPVRFNAHYPRTKAVAEKAVLAANGPRLQTLALRPHLIWGPGDTQFVPRLVARAKSGWLRLVGNGTNLVDTVFVGNAADAHLNAWDALRAGGPCAGRAYFITQGKPRPVREVIARILEACGLPEYPLRSIPFWAAWPLGAICEGVFGLLRLRREPPMTRFLAHQLATPHWYDITAARRDLGYAPAVSFDEGMALLRAAMAPGVSTKS